ncbi:MAG TPA: hypothetical protein VIO60_02300, partial [Rectinemataceae bacterium]
DGSAAGGVGEAIAAVVAKNGAGIGPPLVRTIGFDPKPLPQATREELLCQAGLDQASMAALIESRLQTLGEKNVHDKKPVPALG